MPYTVPNQKIIHINREKVTDNFLQIKKENWYNANKDLEPYGLQLYLYLAGNKDGFDLALSQKAAEEEAGIRSTTFHKYVNVLIEKGYIVNRQGNIFDFYEVPRRAKSVNGLLPRENDIREENKGKAPRETEISLNSREIYNKRDNEKDINIDGFIF